MLTITIDISDEDGQEVLILAHNILQAQGFTRAGHALDLLSWVIDKKKLGLKAERRGPNEWHVNVPR